jgi:hypothetical protein
VAGVSPALLRRRALALSHIRLNSGNFDFELEACDLISDNDTGNRSRGVLRFSDVVGDPSFDKAHEDRLELLAAYGLTAAQALSSRLMRDNLRQ